MVHRWYVNLARTGMLVVILFAVTGMAGWLTHAIYLVQARPDYPLMQYNTAVCLLFCAIAFLCALAGAARWAMGLMGFVLLVSSATFLEYAAHINLGIDTLLITPFTTKFTAYPGRMGWNTDMALLLLAPCIMACAAPGRISHARGMIVAFAACLVFALGAVPMLGYFSGIQEAYRFGTFTRMSLPAALSLLIFSPLLVMYMAQRSPRLYRWLPVPVFIGLVMVSLAAAVAVRVHEEQQISQSVQQQADEQASAYISKLKDLYGALNRISMRWEAAGGTPRPLWNSDTSSYVNDLPFLAAIAWLDRDDRLQWVTPAQGNEGLVGRQLTRDPARGATIARAKAMGQPQVTAPLMLFNEHGLGFLYVRPLTLQGNPAGMNIAVVRIPDFFANLASARSNRSFHSVLTHEGEILLNTYPATEKMHRTGKWRATATITNLNDRYQLTLYPSPEYVANHHTYVPAMVFFGGVVMAVLVALASLLLLRERSQAARLREAEQFTRTILESANYLIIATDVNGIILSFNPEAERTLGYKAAELVGIKTPNLWHDPVEMEHYLHQLRDRYNRPDLQGMEAFTMEAMLYGQAEHNWTFIRKDGSLFPARVSITPRRDPNGKLLGYLGIVKDMTENRRQETLLRESEETFRLAMEYSSIGMALVYPDGSWLKVNRALCEIIGYSELELLMMDFQSVTHPDDLAADMSLVQQVIDGALPNYSMEKRYIHKDGHEIKVLLSVSLIRHEDGTPKYFVSMIHDISEREKLVDQLRQTNTELEQFAYVASHDLQEPLRMVTSFVGLIGQQYGDTLDAKGQEYIGIAVSAAKRMQALINDLLEFARLGRDSQVRLRIDCNTEMKHVLLNLDAAIKGAQATVHVGALPEIVGNPVEFLRLMQNLIGNAIKFHRPQVPPVVHVVAVREGSFWRFAVADNGVGMKSEYYERVFQPFKRLHTQQEFQGSGIGLAVCRKIVENFGGRIWVESVLGQGSTVRFTVPVIT